MECAIKINFNSTVLKYDIDDHGQMIVSIPA